MPGMARKKTIPVRKPLHVWLDVALREDIEAACKEHRRTLREEVAIAIEEYVERLGFRKPSADSEVAEK